MLLPPLHRAMVLRVLFLTEPTAARWLSGAVKPAAPQKSIRTILTNTCLLWKAATRLLFTGKILKFPRAGSILFRPEFHTRVNLFQAQEQYTPSAVEGPSARSGDFCRR